MKLQSINTIEEYNILIQSIKNKLIVIDFTAEWCNACKNLSPALSQLTNEFRNVIFRSIDVDEFSEIADAYNVTSLPTIVFIKNGVICNRVYGLKLNEIYESIQKHM